MPLSFVFPNPCFFPVFFSLPPCRTTTWTSSSTPLTCRPRPCWAQPPWRPSTRMRATPRCTTQVRPVAAAGIATARRRLEEVAAAGIPTARKQLQGRCGAGDGARGADTRPARACVQVGLAMTRCLAWSTAHPPHPRQGASASAEPCCPGRQGCPASFRTRTAARPCCAAAAGPAAIDCSFSSSPCLCTVRAERAHQPGTGRPSHYHLLPTGEHHHSQP